jgi:RNA polymerase sigma factor (TIGR02999 family)
MPDPSAHAKDANTTESSKSALDAALPDLYQELRRIAREYLSRERPNHTLQSTALVHEAYLRLVQQHKVDWSSRAQVLGIAAHMMRRILVNYAISRSAQKRGAGLRITSSEPEAAPLNNRELYELHEALERLETLDVRQAKIVELRFFGGLTVEETAAVVGFSPETVKREWKTARLWLTRELDAAQRGHPNAT